MDTNLKEKYDSQLFLLFGDSKTKTGRTGVENISVNHSIKIKNHYFSLFKFNIVFQTGILRNIIKHKPEVIVIESASGNITNWFIKIYSLIFNIKLVGWTCGWDDKNSTLKNIFVKIFFKGFAQFLAYHSAAENYLKQFGVNRENITILKNTIDETSILKNIGNIKNKGVKLREELELDDKIVLLYVGALLKEKNIEMLIDMMEQLPEEYFLIIVGDGPIFEDLVNYTHEKGITNILFTGKVLKDVDAYYSLCDLFLLPGTGGLAINQAMIHGKAVICGSADGSEKDLIENGKTGIILDDISSETIADTILALNTEKIQKMGEMGRYKIMNEYSFNQFIENYSIGINNAKKNNSKRNAFNEI